MFSGCSVILKERKNNRITKRVYMGKSAGSRLVSGSQKSWIDSGNECLKKRGMDVGQARGMVHYRSDVGGLEGRMLFFAWKLTVGV